MQTEALYQISRRLSAARDEQELLQVLSWPAIEAGALSAALIYVDLDDSGEPEHLKLVATWGQWDAGFPTAEGSRFPLVKFPVSRLWLDNPNEAQLIADVDRDARVDESSRQVFTRIGARATVIIPLNHSGRWVGVLFFTWAEPHAFSRQETVIYHALTGLATGVVESRRLVENLEQVVRERTAELQESQQVLWSILDNIPLRVFWKDRDLNYLGCNRAFASDIGFDSCDWIIGKDDFEVNLSEHAERYRRDDLQVLASGMPKLNYVDRMRTTFITNISHELRTPVTTIQAYAYLMQRTSPEDEKWNQYMQIMLQEVDRQVQLVKDILCVSRIYAGRLEIVPRPTSLNELTEAAVATRRSLAQERELVVVHRPVDPAPVPLVDPQQMTLVLNNLVGDAIRYTQAGGRVVVSTGQAEVEGRVWATVTVSDTGERIPAEDLLHIFERFFREEEPRSARVFYTGLRLMILWEIVALHGGWVTVESGEREGTTFTIWLPLPDQPDGV